MRSFSNSIKLNNVKSYKVGNTNTNNVFKNQFYNNIDKMDYNVYEDIDYNQIEVDNADTTVEVLDIAAKTGATVLIGVTSVLSGVLKIGEYVDDAKCWVCGMTQSGLARLFGDEELAKNIETQTMDYIARDRVGELNKAFYENTSVGRAINDASYMKYDSDVAKGIQNVSTEAVVIVGATAATVATGGAAAPLFAAGFAIGAGQSAEKHFQNTDNRDFWKDSVDIGIDGGIKGLSVVAAGRAGATAVTGIKTISNLGISGIKETAKGTLKYFNKDAFKVTLKYSGKKILKNAAIQTFKDKDFIKETGTILLSNAKSCFDNKEVTWNDAKNVLLQTGAVYASNYIGNVAGGLAEGVLDYGNKLDFIKNIYNDGTLNAQEKYNIYFRYFREHGEGHVFNVADYAQMFAKEIPDVNMDEIIFGAVCHDLGMKGGLVRRGNVYKEIDSLTLDDFSEFEIKDILGKHPEINQNDLKQVKDIVISETVRANHPLNSAVEILSNDIIPEGIDRERVALLAMSHSKSTSGINSMADPKQWNDCIDKLDELAKQRGIEFNAKELKSKIGIEAYSEFDVNSQKMVEKVKIIDNKKFNIMNNEAMSIRDADAMSDIVKIGEDTLMQDSKVSRVTNTATRGDDYNLKVLSADEEASSLNDVILSENGSETIVENLYSRRVHAGELNTNFSSKVVDNNYVAKVTLNNPNEVPNSSLQAIEERLGEVVTYTNCDSRKFIIELPVEASGDDCALRKFYDDGLNKIINKLDSKYRGMNNGLLSDVQKNFLNRENIMIVFK